MDTFHHLSTGACRFELAALVMAIFREEGKHLALHWNRKKRQMNQFLDFVIWIGFDESLGALRAVLVVGLGVPLQRPVIYWFSRLELSGGFATSSIDPFIVPFSHSASYICPLPCAGFVLTLFKLKTKIASELIYRTCRTRPCSSPETISEWIAFFWNSRRFFRHFSISVWIQPGSE